MIKIELNEKEVRSAIAEYINNRYNWVNNHVYDEDVKIEVGREYYDRQPGHTEVFKKAVVTVNERD